MSVGLYMDEHIDEAITKGLRRRGVDVLTVQEDHRRRVKDPLLLDRAAELGRVFFTHDHHFLADANDRQRKGRSFAGLIFAAHNPSLIGRYLQDLEFLAKVGIPEDFFNLVTWLPYR